MIQKFFLSLLMLLLSTKPTKSHPNYLDVSKALNKLKNLSEEKSKIKNGRINFYFDYEKSEFYLQEKKREEEERKKKEKEMEKERKRREELLKRSYSQETKQKTQEKIVPKIPVKSQEIVKKNPEPTNKTPVIKIEEIKTEPLKTPLGTSKTDLWQLTNNNAITPTLKSATPPSPPTPPPQKIEEKTIGKNSLGVDPTQKNAPEPAKVPTPIKTPKPVKQTSTTNQFTLPQPPKITQIPDGNLIYKSLRISDVTYHNISDFKKSTADLDSYIYLAKNVTFANFSNIVNPYLSSIKTHNCHSSGLKFYSSSNSRTSYENEISKVKVGIACFDTFNNVLSVFGPEGKPGQLRVEIGDPVAKCSFDNDINEEFMEIVEEEFFEKFDQNEKFKKTFFLTNIQKNEKSGKYFLVLYEIIGLGEKEKCTFKRFTLETTQGYDTTGKVEIEKYGNSILIKPKFDERYITLDKGNFLYGNEQGLSFLVYLNHMKLEYFNIDSLEKVDGVFRIHSYSISMFKGENSENPKIIIIGKRTKKLTEYKNSEDIELYQVQELIKKVPKVKKNGEENEVYVDNDKNFDHISYIDIQKIEPGKEFDKKYAYFTWIHNETLYIFSHFRENFLIRIYECELKNLKNCKIFDQVNILSKIEDREFYIKINSKKLNSISFDFYDQLDQYGYTLSLYFEHQSKTEKKLYKDFTQKTFFTKHHYAFYRHYFPFQTEIFTVLKSEKFVILDQTLQNDDNIKLTHDRIIRKIELILDTEGFRSRESFQKKFEKESFVNELLPIYSMKYTTNNLYSENYGLKLYKNCSSSMTIDIKQNPIYIPLSQGGSQLMPFINRNIFTGSLLELRIESYAGGINYFIEKSNQLDFKVLQNPDDFTIVDHTFFTSIGIFGVTDKIKMFKMRCEDKKIESGNVYVKECKNQRNIIEGSKFYKKDVISYVETKDMYVIFRCDTLYEENDTLFFVSKANYKVSHSKFNHYYEDFDAFDHDGRLFFIYYSKTKGLKAMTHVGDDEDEFEMQEIEIIERHKEFFKKIKCVLSVSRFGEDVSLETTSTMKILYKVKEFCISNPKAKNYVYTLVFSYDRTKPKSKIYLGIDQIQPVDKSSVTKAEINYCFVNNNNYLLYGSFGEKLDEILIKGDNINLEKSYINYDQEYFNIKKILKVLCFKKSNFATVVAVIGKKIDEKITKTMTGVITLDLKTETFLSRIFDYYELDFVARNPAKDIHGFEEDPGKVLIIEIKNLRKYERRRISLEGPRLHVMTWDETNEEYNARLIVFNSYEKKTLDFIIKFKKNSDLVQAVPDNKKLYEGDIEKPLSFFLTLKGSLTEARIENTLGDKAGKGVVKFTRTRIQQLNTKNYNPQFKEDDLFTYCFNSQREKDYVAVLCYTPRKSIIKILHLGNGQIFHKEIEMPLFNFFKLRHLESSNLIVVVLFEMVTGEKNCIPLILIVRVTQNQEVTLNYFLKGDKANTKGIEPPKDMSVIFDIDSTKNSVDILMLMYYADSDLKFPKNLKLQQLVIYMISASQKILFEGSKIDSFFYTYQKGTSSIKGEKLFRVKYKEHTIVNVIVDQLKKQMVFFLRQTPDGRVNFANTNYLQKEEGKSMELYELPLSDYKLDHIPQFDISDCLELTATTFGCIYFDYNSMKLVESRYAHIFKTVTRKRDGKEAEKEDIIQLTLDDQKYTYDKHSKSVNYIKFAYGKKYFAVLALYDEKQIRNSKILIYKKQDQGGSEHVFYSLPVSDFMVKLSYYEYINFFFREVNGDELLCVYDMDDGKIKHYVLENFILQLQGKKLAEFEGYKLNFVNLEDKKEVEIKDLFNGDKVIKPPVTVDEKTNNNVVKKEDLSDFFFWTLVLMCIAIVFLVVCLIIVTKNNKKRRLEWERKRILNFVYDLAEFRFDETYF